MKLLILAPCIRYPIPDFCVLEDDGQIFFRGEYLPPIPKRDETQIVLDAASVPPSQLLVDSSVAAVCEGEGGVLSFWGWNPAACVWVELANPLPPVPKADDWMKERISVEEIEDFEPSLEPVKSESTPEPTEDAPTPAQEEGTAEIAVP